MKFRGTGKKTGSTEYPHFLWVDRVDALGMGKDTVIVTGTSSDSLLIFDPRKTFSVFRMPYPIPFDERGLDGRIATSTADAVVGHQLTGSSIPPTLAQ